MKRPKYEISPYRPTAMAEAHHRENGPVYYSFDLGKVEFAVDRVFYFTVRLPHLSLFKEKKA